MKKTVSFVAFLFIAAVLFTSCQKEVSSEPNYNPGNNNIENNSSGTFTANVNGTAWQAATKSQSATIIAGVINVTGISGNGQMITISLTGDTVGTYDLSKAGNGAVLYRKDYQKTDNSYVSVVSDDPLASGGKAIITSIDKDKKIIKGTFEAKVLNDADGKNLKITEGAFELTYSTTIPSNPSSNTKDFLKATIDGKAWEGQMVTGILDDNVIRINATTSTVSKTIVLEVPNNIAVGTYNLDGFTYIGAYMEGKDVASTKAYMAISGTLVITENNTSKKLISGSFNFKGETMISPAESKEVTAGTFSVSYKKI